MSGDLKIRTAPDNDLEAATAVTLASYAEFKDDMPPEIFDGYMDSIVSTMASDRDTVEHIIAERDGEIVASVLLMPANRSVEGPDGEIYIVPLPEVRLLGVLPSERGKGVGRALVAECISRARASGAAALSLHTIPFMLNAIKLYENMGFVHIPEEDVAPAPGVYVLAYRMDFVAQPITE
ncbi:MAG: GNAT family N-acetyltransferase [Chloroflexia bacterium]